MSSDAVEEIINIGHDIISTKYYSLACAVLLFYDYLLTLGDEIEFIWSGRKSWGFALFLANRYLPMGYQLWLLIMSYSPTLDQRVYDHNLMTLEPPNFSHVCYRCEKTAFLSVFTFTMTTFLAQVVVILRIYAVTRKNRIIITCFCVITTSQFILGIYSTASARARGAQQILPPLPFDTYRICAYARTPHLEIAFTTLSLVFDLPAFLLVVYTVSRSNLRHFQMSGLLRTMARDSARYFLVIFTSHLLLEFTLTLARPTIQLLPSLGNVVYLPVMIGRLVISLKKAASQEDLWGLGRPIINVGVGFDEGHGSGVTGDDIRMDTFAGGDEGTHGRV